MKGFSFRVLARARYAIRILCGSVDYHYKLPSRVTVLPNPMSLRDLGKRERLSYRQCEPPRLDQCADLGKRVDRTSVFSTAEVRSGFPCTGEVGDRHDMPSAARQFDQLGQYTVPGDIECGVDTIGSNLANPLGEPRTIRDRLGSERTEIVVVRRTRDTDHPRPTCDRELNRGGTNASRSAVDQQCATAFGAELVDRARGGFDGGW